jgi:hypothetical protein
MSDKITQAVAIKDGETVVQYDISYDVYHDGKANSFCVVVSAAEMTDPSDEAEAKTKANVKAKAIKDAWVAGLPGSVAESKEDMEGEVSL